MTDERILFSQWNLPEDATVLVVGDVHGDVNALKNLFTHWLVKGFINSDGILTSNTYIVSLGDLVDYVIGSLNVLHAFIKLRELNPDNVVLLVGNHEGIADYPFISNGSIIGISGRLQFIKEFGNYQIIDDILYKKPSQDGGVFGFLRNQKQPSQPSQPSQQLSQQPSQPSQPSKPSIFGRLNPFKPKPMPEIPHNKSPSVAPPRQNSPSNNVLTKPKIITILKMIKTLGPSMLSIRFGNDDGFYYMMHGMYPVINNNKNSPNASEKPQIITNLNNISIWPYNIVENFEKYLTAVQWNDISSSSLYDDSDLETVNYIKEGKRDQPHTLTLSLPFLAKNIMMPKHIKAFCRGHQDGCPTSRGVFHEECKNNIAIDVHVSKWDEEFQKYNENVKELRCKNETDKDTGWCVSPNVESYNISGVANVTNVKERIFTTSMADKKPKSDAPPGGYICISPYLSRTDVAEQLPGAFEQLPGAVPSVGGKRKSNKSSKSKIRMK